MARTPDDLSTTPGTSGHRDDLSPRRRAQALAVCIAAAFLTLLDVSIVTAALPSMEHQSGLSSAQATWAVAGYTLTFGLALIPGGRLGDEFGRREVLLIGMVLFTLTGVGCGLAPDATLLVVARLARGAAAGLVAPQVVGILHQLYPPRERGRAFGYYGASVSLSTAIGPLLGGAILQGFGDGGRHWIFLLFIPLDVLALVSAARLLPEGRRGARVRGPDLVGALVLGLGVTAVMLPLLQSGTWGERRWWLAWTGLALLVCFARWERAVAARGRRPLVDIRLFRQRTYWVGTLVAGALYGGFTGIFLVLFPFLQQGLHYSPFGASLCTVLFTAGSAVCGIVGGRLVHRVGGPLVIAGTAMTAAGLAVTALVVGASGAGDTMFLRMALPLLLAGCGAGLVIAANQTLALRSIPRREGSTAAGVHQTGMKIGTSLGTTLAGSLHFGRLLATRGDFAAAARAGLAAVAFVVALPGLGPPTASRPPAEPLPERHTPP
ncbi:MFS transporter [Streptomyces sp. NPDC004610]|uniref:MFS transporter n=1 Tax=unclassified Streptomyces TaxID=2593676 RepID=UPI0033B5B1FB